SSRTGARILKAGGNAIDAAIATEFALAVCYPEAGNIGGGGFMLIRMADGTYDVIDYRERAPLASSRNMYLDSKGEVIEGLSTATQLASGVPGTVDGILLAHSRHGSMPLTALIQPAIDLAENGFPISAQQAEDLNGARNEFLSRNDSATAFVKDSPWKAGDTLIQKKLAATLRLIRDKGRDGFYSGTTAEYLIGEMKRGNGIISAEDLNSYKAVIRTALSSDYKGFKIITIPPPSGGGLILLQLLGMTENYPVSGFNEASHLHLVAEAEKRAFADRSEYFGDPDHMKMPAEYFISRQYLQSRMKDFSPERSVPSSEIAPGKPEAHVSEETTHYSVVDAMGNAVATTTTLNGTFGNCIVAGGAGFLLNNEMDDFSVRPGSPNMYGLIGGEVNSVQPGKKILSSMTPVIVEKEGKLYMVLGSPGGSTIPTTAFQVLTNVVDYGMKMQEAVDAGRFHHQWLPDLLYYEQGRIDSAAMRNLVELGYNMKGRLPIGRVSAIRITKDGKKEGGADRRGDNTSCGY
ncbi:MAG TPA: gamma-glutamyltransferase, partial [Bacteroidales bacterium]|nr:gamma-glutamyltransferase [Bacteroidales bacterium]